MPKVSVVIASFNHEKFVRECIQSALDQTYQDFEIVITDDGSPDRTVEVIRELNDPRIRLDIHPCNKGACTAINNSIQKASGEYIAVLNSDDAWEPTKLEKQVAYLDNHPKSGAVFTRVAFIDELSNPIGPADYKHFHVFDQENRSRYAWLNHFFSMGNCLCHPSVLIRKDCYHEVGLYDERMANLPDQDMWVRLCFKYELHILDEKLVRFRIRSDEANASGDRLPANIRCRFEYMQILKHYLTIKDKQTFLTIFPEAIKYGEVEGEYIPYFLSMLALAVGNSTQHLWGLEILNNFLGKRGVASGLETKYGFRYLDFHNLTAQRDVFNISPSVSVQLSQKHPVTCINTGNQSKLLKFAVRLHWIAANFVLNHILRSR